MVIELGVSERRSSGGEQRVSPSVRDDRRWGLESGRRRCDDLLAGRCDGVGRCDGFG